MKHGRPTKYKAAFCDMVVEHMAQGKSVESFCASIGISDDTFYRWVKNNKRFSDAVKLARTRCRAYLLDKLYDCSMSAEKAKEIDSRLFQLYCRNVAKIYVTDNEALLSDRVEELEQLIEELTSGNDKHTH